MKIGILCNSKLCFPSIQYLIQTGHQVFIAMPDVVAEDHAEIENFAMHFQIPVLIVNKQKLTEELLFWKASSELDRLFVITFPYILPSKLIDSIGLEIINFHFGPLPSYKGAQPAFWLIKNGEQNGGITAHVVTKSIDSGSVVHFERYQLSPHETYSSYMTKLSSLNPQVIQKVLEVMNKNGWENKLEVQQSLSSTYHQKPQFNDVRIDWNKMAAVEIERLCRACNSWNKGAITSLNNYPIKLVEVKVINNSSFNELPGTIIRMNQNGQLAVCSVDGKLLLLVVVYDESMGFYSNERLEELGIKPGARLV
jgi:methionyl-tRNA formyltransferase